MRNLSFSPAKVLGCVGSIRDLVPCKYSYNDAGETFN